MNKGLRIIVLFFVLVFLSSPLLVCRVCAIENSWEIMADMPTGRLGAGVATVNGKIYVIGGSNERSALTVNEEYDPVTDTWSAKKRMPTARSNFAIAVYENKIYCIGGGCVANEVYDPETNTWETKASMPTAREFMDANVVDGKIYVIGGSLPLNPNDPIYVPNINEVYDPETNLWSRSIAPPVQVSNYASSVYNDKIYIFSESLTQIYDPKTYSWSNGTSMPSPGWGAAAAVTTGVYAPKKIYVIGGHQTEIRNQIYDPEAETWTIGAQMPTNRYGLGVAVINDVIYAIGGTGSDAAVANERYTPADYIPEFPSWSILFAGLSIILFLSVFFRQRIKKGRKT
jgi:N-acetylneuraminic acid mutarotase